MKAEESKKRELKTIWPEMNSYSDEFCLECKVKKKMIILKYMEEFKADVNE